MTKFTGVRGCLVQPIDHGSVCRAGGKPSTGFPPGTRRAEPAIMFFPYEMFMRRNSMDDDLMKINFLNFFRNVSEITSFFDILENTEPP